jgi:hypothetical protein
MQPIDAVAADKFLRTLFGRHLQERGMDQLIEFRNLGPMGCVRHGWTRLESAANYLRNPYLDFNRAEGWNIYFGANPRTGLKTFQKDIRDVISIFTDIDGKNFSGGKAEALEGLDSFPLTPNIIVDSGNGFHAYWILEDPLLDITPEERLRVRQALAGVGVAVRGDKGVHNLDRIMRLPGTWNVKDPLFPKPCRVLQYNLDYFFSLGDFDNFRKTDFKEPEKFKETDLNFEGIKSPVSMESPEAAKRDVRKLRVSERIRQHIITGGHLEGERRDKTRSGRDQAIITALLSAGYDYETIKSVFFNQHLGCSNRIRESPEKLSWDVSEGLRYIEKERKTLTPARKAILDIEASDAPGAEKVRKINAHIVDDLFNGESPLGQGFKNPSRKARYFFDRGGKLLLDIEGDDFRCFISNRFGLLEKHLKEVSHAMNAHIWQNGREIEPRRFSHYDPARNILFISNHKGGIYVLDGETVRLEDNGYEGVVFEFRSDSAGYEIDKDPARFMNYLEGGFSWDRFLDSLVFKHLVSLASFALEKDRNLCWLDQQYLFSLWYLGLFFESIMDDKPIACFKGVKASGKSTQATAVGKVLFGSHFQSSAMPEDAKDLMVALTENFYMVFDNLDSRIAGNFLNYLCISATSGEARRRKLFTNQDEIVTQPHVFLALTTRDPKFKRDDVVDRLLLFNMQKIKNLKGRNMLYGDLLRNRDAILSETFHNLNSALKLLEARRTWDPCATFRAADWDIFMQKIHNDNGRPAFMNLMNKMNREKRAFSIEDDDLYLILHGRCYGKNRPFLKLSASELYMDLIAEAEALKMMTFRLRYKSPASLARRLANIKEELEDEFNIGIEEGNNRQRFYTIKAKAPEELINV